MGQLGMLTDPPEEVLNQAGIYGATNQTIQVEISKDGEMLCGV